MWKSLLTKKTGLNLTAACRNSRATLLLTSYRSATHRARLINTELASIGIYNQAKDLPPVKYTPGSVRSASIEIHTRLGESSLSKDDLLSKEDLPCTRLGGFAFSPGSAWVCLSPGSAYEGRYVNRSTATLSLY